MKVTLILLMYEAPHLKIEAFKQGRIMKARHFTVTAEICLLH